MSEMSNPYESSAREIADTAFERASASRAIPRQFHDLVRELMVDAAHDAVEFGEAIAELPSDTPTPLEIYHEGYMAAIEDLEGGQ